MIKRIDHKPLVGVLLLALACVAPHPVKAAADMSDLFSRAHKVRLNYAVYLGGLHLLDTSTEYTRTGPAYHITTQAGTQGLAKTLMPWTADLDSKGRIKRDVLQPVKSVVVTTWKDKPERLEFRYGKDQQPKVVYDPPKEQNREDVPEAMKKAALDPLNGIVQLMASFAYGKGCEQTVPVFDGKRRFDVILKEKGTATLEGSDYSVFSGAAQKCQIDLAMRAGTKKDREGSRFWEDRPPVYIYLGQVKENLPPLPVRVETDTFFGSVMVHLTSVEADGVVKTAAK